MHDVDGPARVALNNAEITGDQVRITEQLDEDVWNSVARVLNTLGGSYETNQSAFTFTFDPRPLVSEVIVTGVCGSPAQAEGYVPTPQDLAEALTTSPYSDLERLPKGARVLEPSAGDGRIVEAILEANDEVEVVAVEPNVQRFAHLGDGDGRVQAVRTTFEAYAAGAGNGQLFDAVVMNPPFAVPGKPTVWIDHVMLAWNLLEPGGRLVAVVPHGFSYRGDRRHRDLRTLVTNFGGWNTLPDNTFASGFKTCVIWMARPVPGQEGRPSYVFRHYPEAVDPVRVAYPWLTARAVQEAPVQVWHDPWDGGRERVLRYRAQCWKCGWLLWEFDGNNDMALGNHGIHGSLDAAEHDKAGLSVGLCFNCRQSRETRQTAEEVAEELWSRPPTKAAAASVWSLLLLRGGMLPVDDLERERYARVQAALRLVFGVDEHAPEEQLIDARQAKPWRGGPDRLAAIYLQAYADRLDPDADLDDADRAALLWRSDPNAPAIALAAEPDPWGEVLTQLEFDLGLPTG